MYGDLFTFGETKAIFEQYCDYSLNLAKIYL